MGRNTAGHKYHFVAATHKVRPETVENCPEQILENTDILSSEVISLPIHTELESSNQDFIIDKIIKYFK